MSEKLNKLDWPSERVAKGGIFHPQKVAYSKDTHDLIKCIYTFKIAHKTL